MEAPVVARGIGFSYKRPVVEDFSLAVAAGEVVALLGANGAGKTTALGMLTGALRPRTGSVAVMGGDPRRPAVRRAIGFIPEVSLLPEALTAAESMQYTLGVYGAPRDRRAQIRATLEAFGLGDAGGKRVAQFSKGMMRRLELAQVRLVDPPVWILDEPGSGLDPAGARLLRAELAAAGARGRAVLLSTHAVADAAAVADRLIVLRGGRAAFEGTRQDVMDRLDRRMFVAAGGGAGVTDALRDAAREAGATLEGPDVSAADLEKLLFGEAPGA